MILMCPYCGHQISRPLMHGISSCLNCCRVFDSSKTNRLLSTAWLVRRKHIVDVDVLINQYSILEDEAKLVIDFVADGCCCHEEFLKIINKTNSVD